MWFDKVGAEVFVVATGVERQEYTNWIKGFGDCGCNVDGSWGDGKGIGSK